MTEPTANPLQAEHGHLEFLAFRLGEEEYGIDILQVQEIRSYEPTTHLANTPAFIKGVVNLRGTIVPIVDMRLRFQLPEAAYTDTTVVIVLNVEGQMVGMVVDSVSDVIRLAPADIHPVPSITAAVDGDCLQAIGQLQERMLILLNIPKLLPSLGLAQVATQAQASLAAA